MAVKLIKGIEITAFIKHKVANHVVCLIGFIDFTNQNSDIIGKEKSS